jgi:hypothetical protein
VSQVSKPGLSPVAALCLRVVKGWLGVVSRGKGGELRNGVPYTRLKASEVQQQLEAEQGVAVSSKTVQRALTELVVGGHLSRRQLYKHRYNRTYWYAPGEQEQQAQQHRPTVVAKQHQAKASLRPSQKAVVERSPVSLQVLQAQLTNSPLKAGSSQTAKQPQTGEAPCGQPGAQQEAQQEAVSKAWGKRRPTAPTPRLLGHGGRLEQAQQRLAEVVQKVAAYKGFGPSQQSSASKPVPTVSYKVECAQAAGFLR